MRMNLDVQRLWTMALRSGDYDQGRSQLCTIDVPGAKPQFCCLGVLTDLYINLTGRGKWVTRTSESTGKSFMVFYPTKDADASGIEGEAFYLHEDVVKWAGLDRKVPIVKVREDFYDKLSELNDNGTKFDRIADLIEQ